MYSVLNVCIGLNPATLQVAKVLFNVGGDSPSYAVKCRDRCFYNFVTMFSAFKQAYSLILPTYKLA